MAFPQYKKAAFDIGSTRQLQSSPHKKVDKLVSIDEEVPDVDITDAQVFNSESTLVPMTSSSLTKVGGKEALDVVPSLKDRISNFWGWKGSVSGKQQPDPIKKKEDELPHNKTPSLLGKLNKLGSKLQHLKPFADNSVSPLLKKNKLELKRLNYAEEDKKYGFSEDDEKDSSHLSDSEYQYIMKSRKLFESRFKIIRELGAGGHSTVFLGRRKSDDVLVVCKFIREASVWRWYKDPVENMKIPYEIFVMRTFNEEPAVQSVKYLEHYHLGPGKFVIVMEYLGEEWCDLYDYIENYGPVREDHTKEIFEQVVKTLEYMHWVGYIHNDIKGKRAKLFYGTKKFAAPESILNDTYDPEQQEVWSLGTLLYVLLFKMDPFKTDQDILEINIENKIHRLTSGASGKSFKISSAGVEALLSMLEKDPSRRIGIEAILKLPFFQ